MLQRSVIIQKRPLEWTFGRCKRLADNQAFQIHQGQRSLASARHARNDSPQIPTQLNYGTHQRTVNPISQQTSNKLATWTALSSPFPEFAPVMHALTLNDPFERVVETVRSSPQLLDIFSDRTQLREVATALAKSSDPRRCIEVLDLAHHVGHTLKHGAYEAIALTLSSIHNWELVLWVATSGIQHVGRATVRLLNWRARALLELQQYGLLRKVLYEFQAASITPTVRTFQIVLSGCLRNHDLEGATSCLQRMEEAGIPLDDHTQSLVASFYQHFGFDSPLCQNALDNLLKLDAPARSPVVNNFILSALNADDMYTALKLLTLFDPSSVEGILSNFPKSDRRYPPYEIRLPDLKGTLLEPTVQTFVTCMNYQIRSGNYQRAINIAEASQSRDLPATTDLVTSLVHAYFLQNRGNIGVEIVSQLSNQNSTKAFAALRSRHPVDHPPTILPNILDVKLSTRICNALLRGILQRQGLRHVPKIFAIMHANDLRPNSRTLEILVSYLSRTEGVRPRTILDIMQNLSAASFDVSVRHMHHLIRYILREEKRSQYGAGWGAYDRKITQAVKSQLPNPFMSRDNTLDPLGGLSFGSHTGYTISAAPLIESLLSRDVKSDPVMISMRIRRDALVHGEFDSAHDLFRSLSERGMNANHHHFSALMEGYALMGDLDAAKNIMELARDAGVAPNTVMYTILIHGYGRKQDPKLAMKTFQDMVSMDIYPDIAAIDAVVGAFFAAGARKAARDHLILLWSYIEPFPDSLRKASLGMLITHFRTLDVSRTKIKKTTVSRASVYHQVRRVLVSYRQYFRSAEKDNKVS
ncbi:hypothetical protein CPB83DRAFT_808304 [Crepidotus variabilis]|uniref:Pentatricopeptide repeat-containing protein-mitochondrial domain-containing protein n=1 Tax=Crepidotus variabilis TaxID=179855 RepID=A0A9P6ENI1_9AGAR|nr:hypothetical protein CPB83DRAFT_808304 [Crepidotus variabilis]